MWLELVELWVEWVVGLVEAVEQVGVGLVEWVPVEGCWWEE